jgi:uncharacterized OB-fold protein
MPSAYAPCRSCGKPVYVGAKRCPNCRAPTSWRSRLRSHVFSVSILAIAAIVMVYVALH